VRGRKPKEAEESRSLSTERSEKEAHLLRSFDDGGDEHDANGSSDRVTGRDDGSKKSAFSFSSFRPSLKRTHSSTHGNRGPTPNGQERGREQNLCDGRRRSRRGWRSRRGESG
jgi:hypothetical protein